MASDGSVSRVTPNVFFSLSDYNAFALQPREYRDERGGTVWTFAPPPPAQVSYTKKPAVHRLHCRPER